jgi:transposase
LTNNEAERALRHWVIARRIGMGTRTAQGTRAFAHLASVIETCRKRAVSPWPYLAEVVRQRRQGLRAPPLPSSANSLIAATRHDSLGNQEGLNGYPGGCRTSSG